MKIQIVARRNARQSKSVVFIVALASMLICAVINLAFSVQHAMIESILETVGDNHALNIEILIKICDTLDCDIGDIVELIPNVQEENNNDG